MKAWIISDKNGDYGSDIVFADTRSKAIAQALFKDEFEELSWVDIRARRIKDLDGMENCEPKDNYWLNDDIRLILVKKYDWACIEPQYSDCDNCVAKQYCHWHE